MTDIQAILFDLDGTLLDTEALSDHAVILAFGSSLSVDVQRQLDRRLPWELKRQILGLSGAAWIPIVKKYAAEHWNCVDQEESNATTDEQQPLPSMPDLSDFWTAWEDHLSRLCVDVEACSGAPELVKQLNKAGYRMAIATSSRKAGVEKKRVRHETTLFCHMSALVAGDDPAVAKGKPSPDMYVEAARRLGVDPANCLVFEDALSGVRAGKAAGCRVVAIPDHRFSREEKGVFYEEADVVLNSLWDFRGSDWGMENVDLSSLAQRRGMNLPN